MNAHVFDIDTDRWARVSAIARAISDADLDDFEDVVRSLYAAGLCSRDFMPMVDEAIEQAREKRWK